MFEGPQQQIRDKGRHDLHRQAIFTLAQGAFDLERLLNPFPPQLNGLTPLQLTSEVLNSGPLPPGEIRQYVDVYRRGIMEVEHLLRGNRRM
jgi:hypothetical protein